MAKAPPIPPDQRSAPGEKPHIEGGRRDRHDSRTDLHSNEPGGGDPNLREQGRFGNIRQNVDDVQHKQQDR
jgi:hypothetical protein